MPAWVSPSCSRRAESCSRVRPRRKRTGRVAAACVSRLRSRSRGVFVSHTIVSPSQPCQGSPGQGPDRRSHTLYRYITQERADRGPARRWGTADRFVRPMTNQPSGRHLGFCGNPVQVHVGLDQRDASRRALRRRRGRTRSRNGPRDSRKPRRSTRRTCRVRSVVSASKTSATAAMRPTSGMASPARPRG